MKTALCLGRLPRQYKMDAVNAIMLGGDMETAYKLLTSTGGRKKGGRAGPKNSYFMLDNNYNHFFYVPNNEHGETLLKLLCNREHTDTLNRVLSEDLYERDITSIFENDASGENGMPVLFAYDFNMPRITWFNNSLQLHGRQGKIICFDFQADILRRYCCENIAFQTISYEKFKEWNFYESGKNN